MSETTPETPAEPEAPPGPEQVDDHGTLGERVGRIEEMLSQLLSRGEKAEPEPEASDIKRQARAAVREVQKADGEKAAKAEEERSIKEQIGEIKAALEQPPEEFRRVTQRMGWNRP